MEWWARGDGVGGKRLGWGGRGGMRWVGRRLSDGSGWDRLTMEEVGR